MEDLNGIQVTDNLEAIKGIGEKTARALHQIGIVRYVDLQQHTAVSLSLLLKTKANRKISPKQIEQEEWLGQASRLAQIANDSPTTLANAVAGIEFASPENAQGWRQHAGFSLFFDYEVDADGQQSWQTRIWQTRVYHDETGEQVEMSGIEPDLWVSWIVEKAQLPIQQPIGLPEAMAETAVPAKEEAPDELAATLEILDVQVSEMAASQTQSTKQLRSEIHFQLSGADSSWLAAQTDLPSLRLDVQALDLETGTTDLIESSSLPLKADVFEYVTELTLPLPKIGSYKLHHNLSLNLPMGTITAFYEGPVLQVIP